MKIIRLEAENIKRLHFVEINPDGNVVEITGRNGAGKTSILDSIQWAIEGARTVQAQPIRKGQAEARIRLDLGDVIVTRRFRQRDDGGKPDTSVIVEGANGARFDTPQTLLNSFLSALTFDPLSFARADAKDQLEALRRFVPDVDFPAIDGANLRDFEERTRVSRQAKDARGGGSITIPEDTPATPIDEAALVEELERGHAHNNELEQLKLMRRHSELRVADFKKSAAECRERAVARRKQAEEEDAAAEAFLRSAEEVDAKLSEAGPVPAAINTTAVRDRILEAKRINHQVERAKQRKTYIDTAKAREIAAEKLTHTINARNAAKVEAIAAAKLPIAGLGFGDGCVLLNGVPFEQASDAEQLRASVAIAAAGNPKLRIIRIRDGSLLDTDGMKLLAQLADERDMQIWIERVATDGKVGIVIEDGRVVAHHAKPKPKCDREHELPPCEDPHCWHKHDLGDPIAQPPVKTIEPVGTNL